MPAPTIFTRFLTALGVPHTTACSDADFRNMTFKSLFGLSHLLSDYGVRNMGARFTDKKAITRLAPPFLAQTTPGIFVIVTGIDSQKGIVDYDSRGEKLQIDLASFLKVWNGVVLLAFPDANSREPDYARHRLTEIVERLAHLALPVSALILLCYFFITRQLYGHFSTILLTIFNCVGLYFSYLLVQKSLNIHSAASDRVCGVLEHGGCDSIVKLDVSKLFGVFAWSEIGFAYFGVSLITLLLFPGLWPALAIFNICCLPYTFWSIWYQKFRARHWCTLCVGVQTTLWLLFFCYLGGGWLKAALSLQWHYLILADAYLFAALLLNIVLRIFKKLPSHENDPGT